MMIISTLDPGTLAPRIQHRRMPQRLCILHILAPAASDVASGHRATVRTGAERANSIARIVGGEHLSPGSYNSDRATHCHPNLMYIVRWHSRAASMIPKSYCNEYMRPLALHFASLLPMHHLYSLAHITMLLYLLPFVPWQRHPALPAVVVLFASVDVSLLVVVCGRVPPFLPSSHPNHE